MPKDVDRVPHDQAFKQLLSDFPLEALAFFAGEEGRRLPPGVRTTLLRQEQISARLGQGHREVDFLVLIDFPDGSQEAVVFLAEEEAAPSRDAAFKVAEYVLLVGRWLEKERKLSRIVPVMVFVGEGHLHTGIRIGTELRTYLRFDCVTCHLAELDAETALQTGNLAAAANVMNMRHPAEHRVALCAAAMLLWRRRVANDQIVAKFSRYIGQCARLDTIERVELRQILTAAEGPMIRTIFEDERDAGMADAILLLVEARGIVLSESERHLISECRDTDRLRTWLLRAAQASSSKELFADH